VRKLLTTLHVGRPQRREIEQWRGFQPGRFGYNESPTSSCQTFVGRRVSTLDVPFFYVFHG
jgi:hypothetical protein